MAIAAVRVRPPSGAQGLTHLLSEASSLVERIESLLSSLVSAGGSNDILEKFVMTRTSFKKPRLVIPDPYSKNPKWYVVYYVINKVTGKVVRRRYYKIPGENYVQKKLNGECAEL